MSSSDFRLVSWAWYHRYGTSLWKSAWEHSEKIKRLSALGEEERERQRIALNAIIFSGVFDV